jgi:hydrogenase maturation protease
MLDIDQSKTVVVGAGNIIRSDDVLGVHALRRLETDPRVPKDVVLLDGGTLGLQLLSYLSCASRVLLLDSVNTGKIPGTLIRMEGEELRRLAGGASVHLLGVADLVATLSLVSEEPPEIVLLGMQPGTTEWGIRLTPEVDQALGTLVETAIAELISWPRHVFALTGRSGYLRTTAALQVDELSR